MSGRVVLLEFRLLTSIKIYIMRLHSLKIEGYRRLNNTEVKFGQATFLIGENNVGKSTILTAVELLLSGKDKLTSSDYSMLFNEELQQNETVSDTVVLTGEFYNVPEDIVQFQGFNQSRLIRYELNEETNGETGCKIVYRKTFPIGKKVEISMLKYQRTLKEEFKNCKKPEDFIELGIEPAVFVELFGEDKLKTNIVAAKKSLLEEVDNLWDIDYENEIWDNNPGGIMGNVLHKLPKFILIPAQHSNGEIDDKSGALHEILNELFKEVREGSENYKKAQEYLEKLAEELDPSDEDSEFGKMMGDLNQVLDSVFPLSKLFAEADLSDPEKALKPAFNVEMSSNVKTPVSYQGTGMVRSVVFSLLKYRESWKQQRQQGGYSRTLIIGFEEPEIYLHPNAANQMRDTIYNLASDSTQIICSTHSPYMIDLSRRPKQILNNLSVTDNFVTANPFNISYNFKTLQDEDQTYIKMLQRIDDHVARVFFAKKVVIVEGDTDEIVLKKTIDLLNSEVRKQVLADFQIIKARGKAIIVSLVRYLISLGIDVFVIHDRDAGTPRAEQFNAPIAEALGDENKRLMMEECIEDELGYDAPNGNKPFIAYQLAESWNNWDDIPVGWRTKIETNLFVDYFEEAPIVD